MKKTYIHEAFDFSKMGKHTNKNMLKQSISKMFAYNISEELLNLIKTTYPERHYIDKLNEPEITIQGETRANIKITSTMQSDNIYEFDVYRDNGVNKVTAIINYDCVYIDPILFNIIQKGPEQEVPFIVTEIKHKNKFRSIYAKSGFYLGLILDLYGHYHWRPMRNVPVYTMDDKLMSLLENIKLQPPKHDNNKTVELTQNWVFESEDIFNRFMAWINANGYEKLTEYDNEEVKSEKQLLRRKWYDIKHSHNHAGGYVIRGKIYPKEKRYKYPPRVKDFIIESFNFNLALNTN